MLCKIRTYRNDIAAEAPSIMLMVLRRLFTMARKVKLRCATVPIHTFSNSTGNKKSVFRRSGTVSNTNNLQNCVCLWDSTLANNAKIAEEHDHCRTTSTVPKGTAYAVAISHKHTTQKSCAPHP